MALLKHCYSYWKVPMRRGPCGACAAGLLLLLTGPVSRIAPSVYKTYVKNERRSSWSFSFLLVSTLSHYTCSHVPTHHARHIASVSTSMTWARRASVITPMD